MKKDSNIIDVGVPGFVIQGLLVQVDKSKGIHLKQRGRTEHDLVVWWWVGGRLENKCSSFNAVLASWSDEQINNPVKLCTHTHYVHIHTHTHTLCAHTHTHTMCTYTHTHTLSVPTLTPPIHMHAAPPLPTIHIHSLTLAHI